jgi:DNA-binding protein Fis
MIAPQSDALGLFASSAPSLVAQALTETGGNQSEAARRVGMNRSALIVRLQKYGL